MNSGRRAGRMLVATGSAVCLAAVCFGQSNGPTRNTDYAIVHAKVVTLAGTPIENGTVIVHDGKIAALGEGMAAPAGAKVIEAKGLEVYPGLFDAVTELGLSEIGAVRATVDVREVGAFNPDIVAATAVSPSSAHIPVTRAAGITEVLVVPGEGGDSLIGGQASAICLAGWTSEELTLKRNAALVLNWPRVETQWFDFATFSRKEKPYSDAKKEYDKKIEQMTDWFEQSRHYAQAVEKAGGPGMERDVKFEAMIGALRGDVPVLVFADRAREIRDAVEFCVKQKLRIILTGGTEAWKVKDLLRSRGVPVILRPTLGPPGNEDDPYDRQLSQPEELSQAGVKVAFASFDNSFARRLGQQAANAVSHGLSYEEGLKGVTVYPAQMLGLDGQIGTIEVGKTANLMVTKGDPLELTTEVDYLFIRGQLTSTDNRHKQLYEKYAARPAAKQ